MITRVCLLLAVLVSSTVAYSDAIANEFLKKGLEIPAALQDLGYSQFGRLNLASALNQMPSFPVTYSGKVEKLNGNGRLSAHWENQNGTVTVSVNPVWWKKFPDQQAVLAWHEYLGALGLIDDQYWISVSAWLLSLPEAQRVLDQHAKSQIAAWIASNANAKLPKGTRMAGGVIGIGGGGEGGTLYVKMNGLRRCLRELGGPQSAEERRDSLNNLAHYLSSPLTVTWGTK
jgi:hypothetical protein